MNNVIVYARVSTLIQAEQGYSIDAQLEDCRKKAQELGAIHIEEYIDIGKSGKFLERPELQKMLYNIKHSEMKYDALIIYKLDRLSRDSMGLAYIIKILQQNNIKIISTDGAHYGTNPQDILIMQMMGSISEFENALRKERSIRGKIEKRRQGKIDKVKKYGFIYNDKKKNFDINKEEAEIIKKIFNWFTEERIGAFKIAKRINKLKIPTPLPSKNIHIWHENTIRGILRDESYAGTMHTMKYKFEKISIKKIKKTIRPKSEWIDVSVPTIVEKITWEKAQEILDDNKNNKRNTKNIWLLQGLVLCNICKKPMYIKQTITKSKNTNNKVFYFRCRTKIYNHAGLPEKCDARSVQVNVVEDLVWNTLLKIFYSKETLEKYLKRNRKENTENILLEELITKRQTLLNKKNTITDWFLDGKLEEDIATEKLNKLNMELDTLNLRIKMLKKNATKQPATIESLYNKFHEVNNPDREKKKEIIQSIVDKIYLERLDDTNGKYCVPKLKLNIILY